jgi:hypothetical protein
MARFPLKIRANGFVFPMMYESILAAVVQVAKSFKTSPKVGGKA